MESYNKYLPVPFDTVNCFEIWFPVKDYEEIYEVSNLGRVENTITGKILKQKIDRYGYLRVHLCKKGTDKYPLVSRLVCEAFNRLPENHHADRQNWIRTDNRSLNVRPLQASENISRISERGKIAKSNVGKTIGLNNIIKALSKPVLQYTIDGEFVKEWPSMMEASRQTKIPQTSISACCRGILKHAGGSIWKYKQ